MLVMMASVSPLRGLRGWGVRVVMSTRSGWRSSRMWMFMWGGGGGGGGGAGGRLGGRCECSAAPFVSADAEAVAAGVDGFAHFGGDPHVHLDQGHGGEGRPGC